MDRNVDLPPCEGTHEYFLPMKILSSLDGKGGTILFLDERYGLTQLSYQPAGVVFKTREAVSKKDLVNLGLYPWL